ncbi:MAG TPA: TolC family protein [Candidatus Brocadiia bacterium]|nr:TolC family protein [Candidatus Brocadiia bacterium]
MIWYRLFVAVALVGMCCCACAGRSHTAGLQGPLALPEERLERRPVDDAIEAARRDALAHEIARAVSPAEAPSAAPGAAAHAASVDKKAPDPDCKLSLAEIVSRALLANRRLLDAKDSVETARLSVVAAEAQFELKIMPLASAGVYGASGSNTSSTIGSGVKLEKRLPQGTVASVTPSVYRTGGDYTSSVGFSVTQPLLRGLSAEYNLSGVHGAQFASRTAQRMLFLSRVDTVLSTVVAVYEIVRQRETLRLCEESAARLKGHAEAARAKEGIGLAGPIDTYRATIQLKQAEDALTQAREALRDAQDNLRLILALPLDKKMEVEAPLSYTPVRVSEDEAVRTALANRVELDQAADTVREAERNSRVAKHGMLPELNLVLDYTRTGQDANFGQSAKLDSDAWGMSLSGTTDLWRTAERAAYAQSMVALQAAYRSQELRRDEVALQVKRELGALRRSEQRIAIQQEQIRQAEGQMELARVKFQRGLANNFDVIEAETELRRAQTSLVSAVVDYIAGSFRFRAALGTLIQKPGVGE